MVEGKVGKIGWWFSINQVLGCGVGWGILWKGRGCVQGTADTAERLGLGVGGMHPGGMQDVTAICRLQTVVVEIGFWLSENERKCFG